MKKNKIFIFLCSLFVIVFSFVLYAKINTFSVSSKDNEFIKKIEVPSGANARKISEILKDEGLIRSKIIFYLCARFKLINKVLLGYNKPFALKSGIYNISSAMDLSTIFEILSSGVQEFLNVTIPEGLTISKIGQRLENAGVCSKKDFVIAAKNPALLKKYKVVSESFEGYLFPDTYFMTPMMNAESAVCIMVDNFFEKIKDIPVLCNMTGEELNKTVILASIVEREYRVKEEAPLIASVFTNRIKYNIGLYSCATIEYIITEIQEREHPGVITYDDLAIDSPYNTYKWAGLPPSSISNPGLVALNAAANPAKTNYFYFRLVDSKNGKHVFSKDFSTHINEGYIANTKR